MVTPWYADGLRFTCTGCGKCCTGSPGFVWVTEQEVHAMARFLQITPEAFIRSYTRNVGGRLALLERTRTYDCVFLRDKKCLVYGARPKQCRTFPWWRDNVASPEAWKETAQRCEGIEHPEAPLVPLNVICDALNE
jgi:Fe-S-cluster containining protein